MRKKIVLLVLLVAFGGATFASGQLTVRDDLRWSVTKSPQTGRCYEVAETTRDPAFSYSGFGFMGMAEVSCAEVGLE